MVLKKIGNLWKKNNNPNLSGLVPDFDELTEIKKYVPYLKDFKFNGASNRAGDFKSSFKGRGMEFEEVRSYTFGDDVRDIDWRVTARKNQPYTKLYAEEKDRVVYVWLDVSADMRFGTKKELKSVTAAKVAALLGWFALSNKDRFGLMVYDGNKTHVFEPKRDYNHLLTILKKIEKIAKETLFVKNESQEKLKSLQLAIKRIGKKAIVFLIGGFDVSDDEKLKHEISALCSVNDVCLINIYDALEYIAPPKGQYLAEYKQKQQLITNYGTTYEQEYETYFIQKRKNVKDFCAKFNCRYREIRSDLSIFEQIRPI
ncbi:MAG: DUF58 domain-containing protein [Alphaproteobacteria bacterium]|nr:DUF58 domain-containing protein [Alphaproteobacteria bacterium]